MIRLPVGFDPLLLMADFAKFALPFILIAGVFLAFDLIKKFLTTLGTTN